MPAYVSVEINVSHRLRAMTIKMTELNLHNIQLSYNVSMVFVHLANLQFAVRRLPVQLLPQFLNFS